LTWRWANLLQRGRVRGGDESLVGSRVRKYRKRKGMSQEQLGAMVGFSQSKISKIENGDWDSLSDLKLIAKTLDVKLEELVREDSSGEKKNDESAVDEHKG